jgi:hypothetical protein
MCQSCGCTPCKTCGKEIKKGYALAAASHPIHAPARRKNRLIPAKPSRRVKSKTSPSGFKRINTWDQAQEREWMVLHRPLLSVCRP